MHGDDAFRLQTFSAEIPCEPGYFCENGLKNPCAPGSYRYPMFSITLIRRSVIGYFGWRYGMNTSSCGGKVGGLHDTLLFSNCVCQCARGFYCPSYLNPLDNTDAPAHTKWPGKPHTSAAGRLAYLLSGTHK
jgi:hypothetical protein